MNWGSSIQASGTRYLYVLVKTPICRWRPSRHTFMKTWAHFFKHVCVRCTVQHIDPGDYEYLLPGQLAQDVPLPVRADGTFAVDTARAQLYVVRRDTYLCHVQALSTGTHIGVMVLSLYTSSSARLPYFTAVVGSRHLTRLFVGRNTFLLDRR